MIDVPRHPNKEFNEERFWNNVKDPGTYPCVVCGKPAPNTSKVVHLHGGGDAIVTEDEAAQMDPRLDMGMYPVGNGCLREYPELKPYAQKNTLQK